MMPMRTTVSLDDSLHLMVRSLAHQNRLSMSDTIDLLLRRGLNVESRGTVRQPDERDPLTGFPLIRSPRPITGDDVRSLDDTE
jgi:hypothetical protein